MKIGRLLLGMRPFRRFFHDLSYDFGIAHCEAILRGEEWNYSGHLLRFPETVEDVLGKEWLEAKRDNCRRKERHG